MIEILPHVNVALNGLACALLVTGWMFIRLRRETAHKRTMLTCFGVSILFLTSYVVNKWGAGGRVFPRSDYSAGISYLYYAILATHVVLAAIVPVLALVTIVLGLRDRRAAHRRLARWTFPIWLYVSITGVLVYLFLYVWYLPASG
jgi:uncharacterized membrane protein YozB (DUF420 family)